MSTNPREIHVAVTGDNANDGSRSAPLKTIEAAADQARPGDTITVYEGIYRERINPPRGGTSDDNRIVYQAAPGEDVTIKGSEHIADWEHVEGDTWKVTLPNSFFGDFNPYGYLLYGAWYDARRPYHAGAVYLNGHWLKEAIRKSDVIKSEASGDEDDEGVELLNLDRINKPTGGGLDAINFIDKSDDINVIKTDDGKTFVGRMKEGSHIAYEIDFGEATKSISLYAASPIAGGIIELHQDSIDGELMGRIDVGFTAEWTHAQKFSCNLLKPVSGTQTVYMVFKARPVWSYDKKKDLGYWFAEVGDDTTTIWADFRGKNPNEEFVEINVRQSVFYPEKTGMNYITVRGFTLEQAAAPWVSPTAEQVGLIGTHWSRGWIIEDNTIRYSVCVAVTLGKHGDEHDHTYDYRGTTIPLATENGWDQVGHHVVRNNHIYNNGQGGIEGSLGCSFSTIVGNEIHDIRKDHQYGGCETAGIKLHGAVDVLIKDNHVYNCEHWGGIWLDWMAQGARVSGNLLHDNSQDLMFEVNHGPHLVDNNILLSKNSITEASGGGAFVHNLWSGNVNIWPDLKVRHTPYFKPHSVDIVDMIDVSQNDERFCNNIFTGGNGTAVYNEYGYQVASEGNVFLGGAKSSKEDRDAVVDDGFDPGVNLARKDDRWWLEMNVNPAWRSDVKRAVVTSEQLGKAVVPDAPFENRDGTPYRIDTDYFGRERDAGSLSPGPFNADLSGKVSVKVWPVADRK